MEVTIKDHTFRLFPEKAAYWEEERTLLISDLHIGKIAHFRKAGIAVPSAGIHNNFARLDFLMASTEPERVIIIGDLFHSAVNQEWNAFCEWRKKYSAIDMQIVLGNHDRLPPSFCDEYRMKIYETEVTFGPFTFAHHPRETFADDSEYVISGHVHPQIRLTGKANQVLRFPCFYFGSRQAILPSFGYFTGGWIIDTEENDQVIAIVKDQLMRIS